MAGEDQPDLNTQAGRLKWARLNWDAASSMRGAARAFGWNENTYKSHELGIRRAEAMPVKWAERYGRAFKVRAEWLLTGRGGPFEKADETPEALAEQLVRAIKDRA